MSNAGCAKINKRAIDASTTEISCCCNHLTMLTSYITIVEDPTDPTQNLDISCSEIYDRDTQSKSVNQEQTQWIPAALDICECPVNKKMIGAFKCDDYSDPFFVLKYANFVFILLPVLMMFNGKYMTNTLKLVAYSQILSLLVFVNHPDFYRHKNMLEVFRVDNLAPIFPSFFGYAVDKEYNDRRYLDVKNQIPPLSFFEQGYSSNYLVNLGPLIMVYLIFVLSIPVVNLLQRNRGTAENAAPTQSEMQTFPSNTKKASPMKVYIVNGFITLFTLTFQEELMLISL